MIVRFEGLQIALHTRYNAYSFSFYQMTAADLKPQANRLIDDSLFISDIESINLPDKQVAMRLETLRTYQT